MTSLTQKHHHHAPKIPIQQTVKYSGYPAETKARVKALLPRVDVKFVP